MQDAGNTLTPDLLETLPVVEGAKVIYGDGCLIGAQELREAGITFKQTPYEVRSR
jgi:hypothetical protein